MALLPEHARVVLEVTLLDLARADTALPLGELALRLEALEQRLGAPAAVRPAGAPVVLKPTAPPPTSPAAPAAPDPAREERERERPRPPRLAAGGALEPRTPPLAAPKGEDAFTREVADLFTGRIES
jgi:hypothetical protein